MALVYSVTQINNYIRGIFEDDLILTDINVKGELSNVKYHSSGHIYFTLKDSRSLLSGIMFSSDAYSLTFRMEEGQSVVVTGRIGVYERDGRYQIYAKEISREGSGLLYEKYEKLKRSLEEMGLFDEMYKQPIPRYIKTLGVVTAPTGAAVRDIISIALRRNPYIQIILYPARVQGEGAAESIVKGIKTLEEEGVDTIIIGRGGGSIEDLWAFNEEIVAHAIFNCKVPIISGTGHETDTTIADWAADLRAPTPSAAAELAVFDYGEFSEKLFKYESSLNLQIERLMERLRDRAEAYKARLDKESPKSKLKEKKLRSGHIGENLIKAMSLRLRSERTRALAAEEAMAKSMEKRLLECRQRLNIYRERLNALSPHNTLSRGFSIAEDMDGKRIYSVKGLSKGDLIKIFLQDGVIEAEVRSAVPRSGL